MTNYIKLFLAFLFITEVSLAQIENPVHWKFTTKKTAENEYDLVLLEKHNLKDLEVDTTYFFMGALIRFTEDSILLGYDDYRKTTIETIDVPFTFVKDYVSKIYSNFSDLFIPAEVIGTIIIDELVTIDIDVKKLLTTDNSNVVFGSNRDASKNLSMRWAKDICFSEIE